MGDEPALEVQEALEAPERGSADELLDAGAHAPIDAMRHSAAHVMAEAVLDLFPGAKLGIGPAIDNGFYYDFDLPRSLTPEDLAAVEARMAVSVAAAHPFVRTELAFDDARSAAVDAGQTYKVEILDDLATRAREAGEPLPVTTFYEHGPFSDLCKGPHVATTAALGPFKLLSVAGAYWRGDEKRPMLQRIYGTIWETQEELDQFLWRREEAKKRDHRKLGVRLDLFSFHDVSPGAAFWHPKGWRLYQTLLGAMRELQDRRGYEEVYTPPLVHQKLWERSGHWEHYRDNMFLVEAEEQTFSLKPMNCPESSFIYRSRLRSYRDLPLRLSEYGVLHRKELSGVLSGLTRVRNFVTDDGHIFVRPDQIGAEIEGLMGEIREAYSWFGLTPTLTFGTRPDKALGDIGIWDETEAIMRAELERSGLEYRVKPEDGAFYAPKIDIQITDALGREWQTATIQVDRVMLPERFDLWYIDESGHAAAAGRDPPSDLRLARALHRCPDRALRGGVPTLVRPGPGGDHPDRGPPSGPGPRAGGRPSLARPSGGGRRVRRADAEQDPPGPGAEGSLHARARRSRGGGADGGAAHARRRTAAGRGMGGPGRAARGRGGGAPSGLSRRAETGPV